MTLAKLCRKFDPIKISGIERIRHALNENGYDAEDLDIEAAWSAVCLSLAHRPAFDLVQGFETAKIVALILPQLASVPTELIFEEPDDADPSEEQDDDFSAEGEADRTSADQGEVPSEARRPDPFGAGGEQPKRRGRPPGSGRRGVESL